MMRSLPALLALVAGSAPARAEVTSKPLDYKHGTTTLQGAVVVADAAAGKRPGVLLAHEQGPAGTAAKAKALQLAKLGYVVLVADLYGKDAGPKDAADAAGKLGLTGKDRKLVRERAAAALAALEKIPQVDPKRVAAVGYGVGGTAVLELARSKAELEAVVCVHGDIAPAGDDGKSVGAPLLVIVGADDPKIPLSQVGAFEDEMRKGGVDWQVVRYGGVVGDFTNPAAGRDAKTGRAYDADADQRAADAVRLFLAEVFQPAAKTPAAARQAAGPEGRPQGGAGEGDQSPRIRR